MPQPYKRTVMTIEGERLVSKIMNGNGKIEFVKIVTGNGTYSEQEKEENALREQTELKSQKNIYKINNQEIIESEAETSIRLSAIFSNTDPETGQSVVSEDYYMNEIGVYAREYGTTQEILFSISVTAGDRGDMMLAYVEGQSPIEIHQKYKIAIGSADKVYVKYEPEAYALKNDLDQHKQNTNIHVTNKEILDELRESNDGQLTYKGKGVGNKITVDDTLSIESENPVQNKVLTEELNKIKEEGEEIKKSVSDGKSEVAGSITTMGVATAADATFHTMATNILAIKSGTSIECEPITEFNYSMYLSKATFTWTLPTDPERGGIEIWTKEGDSNFGDTPTGTKIYDSDTFFGTDVTTCDYEYEKGNTNYYAAIYTYTYMNNSRQYVKGKTLLVTTGNKKGFQKFLSSGTFTVPSGVTSIDVFCVCGGYSGVRGGKGGNGGKTVTRYDIPVSPGQTYSVTIGAGGVNSTSGTNAGGNTSFSDLVPSTDYPYVTSEGTGGAVGYASAYSNTPGGKGTDGQYAFNDSSIDGIKYSAGGGGGGYYNYSGHSASPGSGGVNGGGSGGWGSGGNGSANTGSGGGGGKGYNGPSSNGSAENGGNGGSGICIIRWGY